MTEYEARIFLKWIQSKAASHAVGLGGNPENSVGAIWAVATYALDGDTDRLKSEAPEWLKKQFPSFNW